MNPFRICTILTLSLAAAGCVGQPGADDNFAEAEADITRAPATDRDPWVVGLDAGGRHCTGSVLSAHWILTAAHCVTVAQSSPLTVVLSELPATPGAPAPLRHLYQGSAHYYPNPDFNPTCPFGACIDTDADDDIGLIHLSSGAINLTTTGQAPLFADEEEPYHGAGSRWFHMIGYGAGTDPGGSSDCDDGTSRGKRLGVNFLVDVSDDNYQAHAPFGSTHPCGGDSGSPWIFARGPEGAKMDMVFGVMSSMRDIGSNKMWAALVKPRRAFIQTTSAATAHPLHCDTRSYGDWRYRRCDE